MTSDFRLFIVAGEPSGDRLGGALLVELASLTRVTARGVGGADMLAAGLDPVFDMNELSVMGFTDVFLALPRLLSRLGQTVRAALSFKPDVIVLIDNKVFSQMAAVRLRRAGFTGAILLYVAPTVWAWKPDRARKIAPLFDEVLAVLPFEPKVMAELGGPPTVYVGHPATRFIEEDRPPLARGKIMLLPGSRGGELRRHLPMFGRVAAKVAGHESVSGVVLPTLPHLRARIASAVADWPMPVDIVVTAEERRAAYAQSIAALVSAGTATLELALMDVPMVATYVPDWLQMRAYRRWGSPQVMLPNIVLSEDLVPEIQPGSDQESRTLAAFVELIASQDARARQKAGFVRIRDQIVNGLPGIGRQSAAVRVLTHSGQQKRIKKAGP